MVATRSASGGIAFYVCNAPGPDGKSQTEIDRVIEEGRDDKNKVACVAMEYTPVTGANGGQPFTKFFTFGPDETLLLSINLDGRGEKFMPGSCVACHGGSTYNGRFPEQATASPFLGARFLSDDAVPVRIDDAGAFAAPGVPSPRFREDSFARFSDVLPTDAIPSSGKLSLSERLGDDLVETRESPLTAIYVLRPVEPDAGACAVRTAMPPIAATMALVQNAKLAKLLWGEESERLLHLVAEVSRRVPVWTLDVPRDLDLLPGVVERLLEWHAVPEPQSA